MDILELEMLVKSLSEQKEILEKQVKDLTKEENRLRYMATGYVGLIAITKDTELIAKAAQIAIDADKASEEVIISNQE